MDKKFNHSPVLIADITTVKMRISLILLLLPGLNGCAYLHDRARDASDIVTVAVETSIANAGVQLGPLITGVGLAGGYGFGLRSGSMGAFETEEVNLFFGGKKMFTPSEYDQQRGKGYDIWYGVDSDRKTPKGSWFNWCQCEVSLGAVIGGRVGVNVGEMLDFFLGWTTLDICEDDDATIRRNKRLESNMPQGANNIPERSTGKLVLDR